MCIAVNFQLLQLVGLTNQWSILQNKDEMLNCTAPAFKCDQQKRKGYMGSTMWKHTVESIIHIIWK